MSNTINSRKIRQMFADHPVGIDREKKRQAYRRFDREIAEKTLVPRMSWTEIIRSQLRFVEWRILLSQLLCVFLSVTVYARADLPWLRTAPFVPTGVASALSAMLLVLVCNREDAAGIAELAASCYFNNRQLATFHMVLFGGIQLAFLAVSAVLLGERMQTGTVAVGLYLLVPYLLTGCVEFAVLLTRFGRRSNATLLAAGCVMAVINASAATRPELYEPAATGAWAAVCAVCAAVCAAEFAVVRKRMKYAGQYLRTASDRL